MLPADLQAAEAQALAALRSALGADPAGRWTMELRFEGLRLLPVVLRLARALQEERELGLLFADAGAAALARRDGADLAPRIASFADQRRVQAAAPSDGLLLLVGASQAEYEEVERLCGDHRGAVVLINAVLEDGAVGIGSVARQRRRGFLSTWQAAYALIPQAAGVLRRAHPGDWELYRLDPDGYRLAAHFERKPDGEQQQEALGEASAAGIGGSLRALDQLLEGLQN
jgi:hypothetical protein